MSVYQLDRAAGRQAHGVIEGGVNDEPAAQVQEPRRAAPERAWHWQRSSVIQCYVSVQIRMNVRELKCVHVCAHV